MVANFQHPRVVTKQAWWFRLTRCLLSWMARHGWVDPEQVVAKGVECKVEDRHENEPEEL